MRSKKIENFVCKLQIPQTTVYSFLFSLDFIFHVDYILQYRFSIKNLMSPTIKASVYPTRAQLSCIRTKEQKLSVIREGDAFEMRLQSFFNAA